METTQQNHGQEHTIKSEDKSWKLNNSSGESLHKFNKIFILIIGILLLLVGFIILSNKNNDQTSTVGRFSENILIESDIVPSPTPFPFIELTIPYLRNREYKSQFNSMDIYSENSSYTAYLTSYNSDGYNVNALLTKPSEEIPESGFPAIIFIHGYIPPTSYVTTENYASYVDYLARNGFVVLKIDLRGHGNSEGLASGAYYSSDYIIDVLNAYNALEKLPFVDPEAIGLWGHSMAGNVVLRSLASKPTIPASVIWAGAVYTYKDMQEYGINDTSYRPPNELSERQRKRQELRLLYGDFNENSSFWQQVAPTNYLGDLKGAIQLNHALDDDVVDIGYSRNLTTLLSNYDIVNELHEYTTGGHNLSGTVFNQAMQNTVDFFKKYL